MKRKQIGTTQIDTSLPYWSGGKSFEAQKQNERLCYSFIDRYQAEASIASTEAEIQSLYNEMDLQYTIIKCVEHFGANTDLLFNAGICISNEISCGSFAHTFQTLDERNSYVDGLVASIINRASSLTLSEHISSDFIVWYEANIIAHNYYLTADGEKSDQPPVRIGAEEDENARKFREGSMAFIYTITDLSLIEDSRDAMYKRKCQQRSREVLANGGLGLSQQVQDNLIVSGTIDKLGMSVNDAVRHLRSGVGVAVSGSSRVGDLLILIGTIISAVCSLLSTYFVAKFATKQEKIKADAQKHLNETYLRANAASENDFEYVDGNITLATNNPEYQKTQRTKYIAVCGAVALVALAYIL